MRRVQMRFTRHSARGSKNRCALSAISRVEELGFTRLTTADAKACAAMFQLLPQLPITDAILDQTVKIQQQLRIKTPDAIVAATALVHGLALATADQGFGRVAGLVVIDPLGLPDLG